MRSLILIILIIFSSRFTYAQKEKDSISRKDNPIVFMDANIGYSFGVTNGLSGGLSLNYQIEKNLFKFRFFETSRIENVDVIFGIIPISIDQKLTREYSILYGRRFVKNDLAYHFAGGISYSNYKDIKQDVVITEYNFVGFPLEFGIHWFHSKKERYKVLFGLIPVGKPTSFGRGLGLKLYGNLAKRSYIGVGITFGLGWHKKY